MPVSELEIHSQIANEANKRADLIKEDKTLSPIQKSERIKKIAKEYNNSIGRYELEKKTAQKNIDFRNKEDYKVKGKKEVAEVKAILAAAKKNNDGSPKAMLEQKKAQADLDLVLEKIKTEKSKR